MRLRHADRHMAEPAGLEARELVLDPRRRLGPVGTVDFARDGLDLLPERQAVRIDRLEFRITAVRERGDRLSQALRARAALAQWVQTCTEAPRSSAGAGPPRFRRPCPPVKRLIATTAGTPELGDIVEMAAEIAKPRSTAATSSSPSALRSMPPCILSARTVATTTTASGSSPALRHLMSKNFSAPRSAPKPASVTT